MRIPSSKPLCLLVLLSTTAFSRAVTLLMDYSYDSSGFFGNATARNTLEKAASDLGNRLPSQFGPIATNTITGINGSTQIQFQYSYHVTNPRDGTLLSFTNTLLDADTIRIYVGARDLGASTLGLGGPTGVGLNIGGNGYENEFLGALAIAEATANTMYGRGSGPGISNISGSLTFGSTTGSYNVTIGSTIGSVTFNDTSAWHYDAQSAVAPGTFDLYSVALHEMMHVLGIGASSTWNDLANGNEWLGTNAAELAGLGLNLIANNHIAEGTMSTSVVDLTAQEANMDPTLTVGTRKYLTALDDAFLQDLNYQTTLSVPEPSSGLLLVASLLGLGIRRKR